MHTRKKIFRLLFNKYANSGYSNRRGTSFDALGQQANSISLAELNRMLAENAIMPRLVAKDEINTLVRLVNLELLRNRHDLTSLQYKGFLEFYIQCAVLAFGREPINLSQSPPVASLEALMRQFEKAFRARGESTVLFEDPDYSAIAD